MILLEFLFFIQHKKVSAGISIYNKKFISVFCEDFLDSLFKMEKREQELQRLYSKKLFKKKIIILKIFCYLKMFYRCTINQLLTTHYITFSLKCLGKGTL